MKKMLSVFENEHVVIFVAMLSMFFAVLWTLDGGGLISSVIGADYRHYFRPASIALLSGQDPYSVSGFHSPPWLLLLIAPLTWLPERAASSLLFVLNLSAYAYTASRIGVSRILVIPFVVFCGALMNATIGNFDGLVSLGLWLPTPIAYLVLMIKPQIGIPIIALTVISILASRRSLMSKISWMVYSLAPLLIFVVVSGLIYGDWFSGAQAAVDYQWNSSPWPLGIPLGVALLWLGYRKVEISYALIAIPFLTPYLSGDTWSFATMGVLTLCAKSYEKQGEK